MTRTPGTRRTWSTLAEWLAHARAIHAGRISARQYQNRRAHVAALAGTLELIGAGTLPELAALDAYIREHEPPRGQRAGTPWPVLKQAIQNTLYEREQLARLTAAAEDDVRRAAEEDHSERVSDSVRSVLD